jgi:hypothetical protein
VKFYGPLTLANLSFFGGKKYKQPLKRRRFFEIFGTGLGD